jgi:hypothetical protein
MRRALAVALVVACRTPYQAEATAIGDGRIMVRAESETSEGEASQRAYARAHEVCPDGYEVVDDKAGTAKRRERVAVFGRRTVESPEVTLVVRCTAAHP